MRTAHEISAILQKLRGLYLDTHRDATFHAHLERLLTRDEVGNLIRRCPGGDWVCCSMT